MKLFPLIFSVVCLFIDVATLQAVAPVGRTYYVSTVGNDASSGRSLPAAWRTIQKAAQTVPAGSTVLISAGTYNEKVTVTVSGNATAGYIIFKPNGLAHVVVSGSNVSGEDIFLLNSSNYVRIQGLEICDNSGVTDGSGIRIDGYGDHCQFLDNAIHAIYGTNAMGMTFYGSDATRPISNLTVTGNTIYDCQNYPSEMVTFNGNVNTFLVNRNTLYGSNGVVMDFIGFEGVCPTPAYDQARNGTVRGNIAHDSHGSGMESDGFYVDGGVNIVIESNISYNNDYGIEVGCEHAGHTTRNIVVRDNLCYGNQEAGLNFGGYDSSVGTVTHCQFLENTCYGNNVANDGTGDLYASTGSANIVRGNIIYSTQPVVFSTESGATNDLFDYNLYYCSVASPQFSWLGQTYSSLAELRAASKQDAHSRWANPKFTAVGARFTLQSGSPAINAGPLGYVVGAGETDLAGKPRIIGGRIDIGAYEFQ